MAAASFTAAKFLAPVAARSGGDKAPSFPAAAAASMRPLRRRPAPRLSSVLAVSSDVLAGNKAAPAAAAHPVRKSYLLHSRKCDLSRTAARVREIV